MFGAMSCGGFRTIRICRGSGVTGILPLAAASLAVGIGLAAAFASLADAVLLRPLPVARPDEIVRVFSASPRRAMGFVSYPDFLDFARDSRSFSGMIAQSQVLLALGGSGGETPEVRMGLAVTANYFDVLQVSARLGRTFQPGEGRLPVMVLSDALWRSRFSGDPRVVGSTVPLAGMPFTILGVAPPGFGLDRFLHEDFYVPIGAYAAGLLPGGDANLRDRGKRYFSVYARLARGANAMRAQAEMDALARALAAEYPETDSSRSALVLTDREARARGNRMMPVLAGILIALAALLFAIACANAAGLILLKAEARAGETALRSALGESAMRALSRSMAESLAIAGAGTMLALPVGWAAVKGIVRSTALPADLPIAMDARLDSRVMALLAAAALITAMICGIAPWFVRRGIAPAAVLKRENSRGGHSSRSRNALVATQIAMAAALVAGCGAFLTGLAEARRVELGYRTDRVLTMALDPAQTGSDEAHTRRFYEALLDRIRRKPGVERAELGQSIPLGFAGAQRMVKIEGAAGREESAGMAVWMSIVTPGYFELMRMPVTGGRTFAETDQADAPRVAVVNEAMAKMWPGGQAIGRRMVIEGKQVEIIGVVKTAKYFELTEPPRPFFYLPFAQNYASRMVLHLTTRGEPGAMAPAALAAIREIDRGQPVSEVRALDDYFSRGALFGTRVGARLTMAAGGAALLLALAGLYGAIASAVERRRREIGIRMALGAEPGAVLGLVIADGLRIAIPATAVGLAAAMGAWRWMGAVMPVDGGMNWSSAAAGLIVVGASVIASAVPAWKAAAMDPAEALRRE